ncbi:ABC transporter permease [Peptoclostridium sp. AF21-18]|uniref:ABC transporter permease n=1 Tax=Peptoclostridium sp. AF21-18 TaxID=2292243 RepID=UPI000E537323|nr:ABC transporter permease [Peptoclostridium sp. AF21-18]RHQ98055.1 hypothetical protein DWX74_05635 [Peptoclostridium sp. AF21-18]
MKNTNLKKLTKSKMLMVFIFALIAVVLILGVDAVKISKSKDEADEIQKSYGIYHTEYVGITEEQILSLFKEKDIERIDNIQNLGEISTADGSKVELKSFEGRYYATTQYFAMKSQKLVGKQARNNNEIVLDEEAAKILGVGDDLGKEINVNLEKEYTDKNGEKKTFKENKKFKVVGFVKKRYEDNTKVESNINRRIAYTYGNGNENVQGLIWNKGQELIPDEAVTYDVILRFKTGKENHIGSNVNLEKKVEQVGARSKIGKDKIYPNSNYINKLSKISIDSEKLCNKGKIIIVILAILAVVEIIYAVYTRKKR